MHVTPEFAGLVAQVFPTLMIAILIEGRVMVLAWAPKWFKIMSQTIRTLALMGGVGSTFLCLGIASGQWGGVAADHPLSNFIVFMSSWSLGFAFVLMLSHVFGGETQSIFDQFFRKPKIEDAAPESGRPATAQDLP